VIGAGAGAGIGAGAGLGAQACTPTNNSIDKITMITPIFSFTIALNLPSFFEVFLHGHTSTRLSYNFPL
jgi:hypothetical protein